MLKWSGGQEVSDSFNWTKEMIGKRRKLDPVGFVVMKGLSQLYEFLNINMVILWMSFCCSINTCVHSVM